LGRRRPCGEATVWEQVRAHEGAAVRLVLRELPLLEIATSAQGEPEGGDAERQEPETREGAHEPITLGRCSRRGPGPRRERPSPGRSPRWSSARPRPLGGRGRTDPCRELARGRRALGRFAGGRGSAGGSARAPRRLPGGGASLAPRRGG